MKLLLDTHIFLWFINNDRRLSNQWRTLTRVSDNAVYLSVVSLWEVIIKYQLKKLILPESPEIYFRMLISQVIEHGLTFMTVDRWVTLTQNPHCQHQDFQRFWDFQDSWCNLILFIRTSS